MMLYRACIWTWRSWAIQAELDAPPAGGQKGGGPEHDKTADDLAAPRPRVNG